MTRLLADLSAAESWPALACLAGTLIALGATIAYFRRKLREARDRSALNAARIAENARRLDELESRP